MCFVGNILPSAEGGSFDFLLPFFGGDFTLYLWELGLLILPTGKIL
jgi:hypothetical protein